MDFTFNDEQTAVREAVQGIFSGLVTPTGSRRSRPPRTGSTGSCGPSWPGPTCWAWPSRRPRRRRLRHGRAVPAAGGPGRGGRAGAAVGHSGAGRPARSRVRIRCPAGPRSCPGWWPATSSSPPPWPTWPTTSPSGGEGRPAVTRHAGIRRWARPSPGTAFAVPYAHVATRVLVPVATDAGVVVAAVDPTAAGVTLERAVTTNREVHPTSTWTGWPWPPTTCSPGATPHAGAEVRDWISNGRGPDCAPCRWGSPSRPLPRRPSTSTPVSSSACRWPPSRPPRCGPPTPPSTPRRSG